MEQRKKSKKHIIKWICCILVVLLIGGMVYQYWYKPKSAYQPQPHTNEELLLLFQENRALFDEVARILNQNDRFWKEGRTYKDDPYDTHPWLGSPNDRDRMALFAKEEQETLRAFFEKTKPYMITLDLAAPTEEEMESEVVLKRAESHCLRIDYTNQDYTDSYAFIYSYGDETSALQNKRQWGYTIVDLEGNWYFCYR